ncbi:MAG TPA: thiol:disulfide interchange protein DsbA/DsbL [Zeimonas sp.]
MIDARRRTLIAAGAALAGATAVPAARAQSTPVEGRDYRLVKPAQPTEAPSGKVEVIEFFWYGCPHCNSLEPLLKEWVSKLPADVVFRRVHVPFGDRRHQQLYYTLESMGVAEKLNDVVFRAIHVDGNRLDTPEKMVDVLSKHGVDKDRFLDTWKSFTVRTKMSRGTQLTQVYGVDGVPAMAVAGKYYTAPSLVGSNAGALRVIDWLVQKERQTGR